MGEKLIQYYKYVTDQKGIDGKMQLAKMTVIPSMVAATAPDSPENILKFRKAIEVITGRPAPHL